MSGRAAIATVRDGEVVTLLGRNGAGRSTILKTISGIIDPNKGQIKFRNEEIHGWQPDRIVRAGISHVPEGREVFPLLSVLFTPTICEFSLRAVPGSNALQFHALTIFLVLLSTISLPLAVGVDQKLLRDIGKVSRGEEDLSDMEIDSDDDTGY